MSKTTTFEAWAAFVSGKALIGASGLPKLFNSAMKAEKYLVRRIAWGPALPCEVARVRVTVEVIEDDREGVDQ